MRTTRAIAAVPRPEKRYTKPVQHVPPNTRHSPLYDQFTDFSITPCDTADNEYNVLTLGYLPVETLEHYDRLDKIPGRLQSDSCGTDSYIYDTAYEVNPTIKC